MSKTTPTATTTPLPTFTPPPLASSAPPKTSTGGGSQGGPAGVPIGIPWAQDPTTKQYVPTWTPPMWIDGQGPVSQIPSGLTGRASFETSQVHGTAPAGGFYVNGDENQPITRPEDVPAIQNQLVQAGLVQPSDITPGLWTATEANAYYQVLGYANQYGVGADKMLGWMATHHQQPPVKLTQKADVDALATQIIPKLIDRELTSEETARFEADYGKWELSQANQANEQATSAAPVQTAPESSSTFATDWAKENLGADEGKAGFASVAQRLHSLLTTGG